MNSPEIRSELSSSFHYHPSLNPALNRVTRPESDLIRCSLVLVGFYSKLVKLAVRLHYRNNDEFSFDIDL